MVATGARAGGRGGEAEHRRGRDEEEEEAPRETRGEVGDAATERSTPSDSAARGRAAVVPREQRHLVARRGGEEAWE